MLILGTGLGQRHLLFGGLEAGLAVGLQLGAALVQADGFLQGHVAGLQLADHRFELGHGGLEAHLGHRGLALVARRCALAHSPCPSFAPRAISTATKAATLSASARRS